MTTSSLWTVLSDSLDIPRSRYEQAAQRHRSVGDWLCRPESALSQFRPSVRPQGSFRFGTVVQPLDPNAEYDLDHVVVLEALTSQHLTQHDLKKLLGAELELYARRHGMMSPKEKNRCWRLRYRDEVGFHLDSLPAVPAEFATFDSLIRSGVSDAWARLAIRITDKRHPGYDLRTATWLTSNPRGFARWFEAQAARGRSLPSGPMRAEVENVPPYEWRTPLQRSIQIMKRHRDVMFREAPELAPISMIITNLAARAYQGQSDVDTALPDIVSRMPSFVRATVPRVPNPTHPDEDYADKWRLDPRLEYGFRQWHATISADVARLSSPLMRIDRDEIKARFALALTDEQLRELSPRAPTVLTGATRAAPAIASGLVTKPWGEEVRPGSDLSKNLLPSFWP